MAKEQRKRKPGSGGRRAGAGRKPNYLKKLGASPLTAAHLLAHVDERKLWESLLTDRSPDVRLRCLQYLVDRRDGRPRQAMDFRGALVTASLDDRLEQNRARLAGLGDKELQAELTLLEDQLGLTAKPTPGPVDAPAQRLLPAAPESTVAPRAEPKPVAYSETAPTPAIPSANMPVHTAWCDAHGSFTPKSKWEPSCPDCKLIWEQQDRADKTKMGCLQPGEPLWGRR